MHGIDRGEVAMVSSAQRGCSKLHSPGQSRLKRIRSETTLKNCPLPRMMKSQAMFGFQNIMVR